MRQESKATSVSNPVSVNKNKNTLTVAADELEAIEKIMDPSTTPGERIEIIISRVKEMLAFPFTIVKILEITQNDQTGANDLAKAIEADPVVVSSLLSISNTVYYARQGKRINDIQEAIVRLGFIETKNIALSLSVMSLFSHDAKCQDFNRFEFWYHSLACGILSEIFARKARYPSPEKAFICGLLHDFGIILLDEFFNTFFTSIYEQVSKNKSGFIAEEKRLWGMSHNSAVAQLFKGWNMPSDVTYTISQLDQFGSRQSIDNQYQDLLLVNIIGLSNLIVKSLQLGKDCDDIIYPVNKKILAALNCADGIDKAMISTCMFKLNAYTDFFKLEKRNFTYPEMQNPEARSLSIIEHTKEVFFPHKYCLIMQGYIIDESTDGNKEKILEKNPEAILNLINSSISEKYLEPFLNIPKNTEDGKTERFLPAIFLTLDKRPNLNFESLSNAYCMPASVSMEVLSQIVDNMISGKSVTLLNGLTEQNDSSEQPIKTVTINYLNDQIVLITLRGTIRLNSFNEIRSSLVKILEQKTNCIAIQVNDIVDIDNLMTNLLINFQKKSADIGLSLSFCSIGKDPPQIFQNHESLKTIHNFHKEHELVSFLKKSTSSVKAPG
jgi:HD-like signal output (HDOD) protein/anti-anti-sigma regulatory factor